jgi:hypothetical protein
MFEAQFPSSNRVVAELWQPTKTQEDAHFEQEFGPKTFLHISFACYLRIVDSKRQAVVAAAAARSLGHSSFGNRTTARK